MANSLKYVFISVGLSALLSACSAPTNVSYFQDAASNPVSDVTIPATATIRLRPEDKISIVVNSRDPQLTNMFNLPYISQRIGQTATDARSISSANSGYVMGYSVDSEGDIDFPVLGKIHVAGLQRSEVATLIKDQLLAQNLIKDPVVTVEFMNLTYAVLGEVSHPGRYSIEKDKITILDALSAAGDLTINGRRENVLVIRDFNGVQNRFIMDLTSIDDVIKSPAYYLQQGDVVYVEPNDMRIRQSTINGNNVRSTSFWISIASLAATLVTTISVISR